MLTPGSHLDLSIFDERSATLFKALIKILARDNNSYSRGKSLNFEASVLNLCQHLLDWANLIDDV